MKDLLEFLVEQAKCCACEKRFKNPLDIFMIAVPKYVTWEAPVVKQQDPNAPDFPMAYVCVKCANKKEPIYVVEWDLLHEDDAENRNIKYHLISELDHYLIGS